MAQVACNDFNKRCIDAGRVYQPGFTVYITLAIMNSQTAQNWIDYHLFVLDRVGRLRDSPNMVLVLLNAAIEQLVHAIFRTNSVDERNTRYETYGKALNKLRQDNAIEESVYLLLQRVRKLRNSVAHDALFEPSIEEIVAVVELLNSAALPWGEKFMLEPSDQTTVYIAVYVFAHNRLQGSKFATEQAARLPRLLKDA